MDLSLFAGRIVQLLGGQENIRELTYCPGTISFRVENNTMVQERIIEDLEVCKHFYLEGNEFQLYPTISGRKLFKAILVAGNFGGLKDMEELYGFGMFSNVGTYIASVVVPVLPVLLGNCILTILVFLLAGLNLAGKMTIILQSLTMLNSVVYLVTPFLIGASACRRVNRNALPGILLVASLLYPVYRTLDVQWTFLIKDPGSLTGMHLAILPVLLVIFLYDRLDCYLHDRLFLQPIRLLLSPFSLLLIVAFIQIILYPAGVYFDRLLSVGILFIFVAFPPVGSAVLGLLTPLLLMAGFLYGDFPITVVLEQLNRTAFLIGPGFYAACLCQGAAAIYTAIREKDRRIRRRGLFCGCLSLVGFLTPVILAVNVRYKHSLVAGMLGGCLCGIYFGIFGVVNLSYSIQLMVGLLLGVIITIVLLFLMRPAKEEEVVTPTRQGILTNYPQKYRIK